MVCPRMDIRFVPMREAWSAMVILLENEIGGLGGGGSMEARLAEDMIDGRRCQGLKCRM